MIADYYKNKDVFITGGSGIIGRGIIEKLLRSTEVNRVFMLLRYKKGSLVENRLKSFKNGPVFRRLQEEKPNALDKLIAIPGDISLPLLGISTKSFKALEDVSLVIHSAATVRFDEPIRLAINLNVSATYEAIKVAKRFNKLELFVHISTYYSNPALKFVENKIYPPPIDWREAIKLSESNIPDEILNVLGRKYIQGFPNTYTFTKNLSENVVNEHSQLFPVLIVRPSIIVQSLKEPFPGYIETFMGITGVSAMFGTGLFRTDYGKSNVELDLIFLDSLVNMLMIMMFDKGAEETRQLKTSITLMCSANRDPHTYGAKMYHSRLVHYQYPFLKSFWIPGMVITPFYPYYIWRVIVYQVIPAAIIDLVLVCLGKKPVVLSIQRKAHCGNVSKKHFVFNSFRSGGTTDVERYEALGLGTDFDISDHMHSGETKEGRYEAYKTHVLGMRRNLLKEDDSSLPQARLKMNIFRILDFVLKWAIYYKVAQFLLSFGNQRMDIYMQRM